MVCNRSILGGLSAAALLVIGGSAANAQVALNPGSAVVPPVTAFFGGTQQGLASSLFSVTNNGQTISGTLISAVYSGGTGASGLDFYYQIITNASGNQGIQSMSLASFAGATITVAQTATDIDGAATNFTTGVTQAAANQRSLTNNGSGLLVDFGSGINVNSAGYTQIIRTTATTFSFGGSAAFIGTSGVAANGQGLVIAPVAVTAAPEPGSLALLGMGALALGGVAVRRRKK